MQEESNLIIQGARDCEGAHPDPAMLESHSPSQNPLQTTERRLDPRQQVSNIMYVQLGEHNGGVILNVSEGGLAVQAATPLMVDQLPALLFQLSANNWVQASARIAWLAPSKRTAGLQFNDLSETARADIRGWIERAMRDLPPQPPSAEKTRSTIDATPQDAVAHAESDPTPESQQDSVSPRRPQVPLPSSKATVSSETGVSNSPQRDELPEKQLARESVPPERRHSAAIDTVRGLPGRVIVARLRRYLVEERHRIRLYDLVAKETESLCAQLTETNFPANVPVTVEEFLTRIHRYEEFSEALLSIIATGCFWGDRNLEPIWPKMIERVASVVATHTGNPQWVRLRFYPALLLLYAGGMAAIARGNYAALAALLLQPKLKGEDGNYCLIEQLYTSSVIGNERFRAALCGATQYKLSASAYLYAFLRERLREFVPSDTEYSAVFDRFEYLLALVWTDQNPNSTRVDWIPTDGPLGLFASKTLGRRDTGIIEQMDQELSDLGEKYPLLRSGLFGGSTGRLRSASRRIAEQIQLAK
jgi:hypothetical protein